MKFAKKMVLVDAEYAHNGVGNNFNNNKVFEVKTNSKPTFNDDISNVNVIDSEADYRLAMVDKEILNTLNDKRLSDYDKANVYGNLLRKYLLAKSETRREKEDAYRITSEKISKKLMSQPSNDNGFEEIGKKQNHLFFNTSTPSFYQKPDKNEVTSLVTELVSNQPSTSGVVEKPYNSMDSTPLRGFSNSDIDVLKSALRIHDRARGFKRHLSFNASDDDDESADEEPLPPPRRSSRRRIIDTSPPSDIYTTPSDAPVIKRWEPVKRT